ncbi:MAG: hypothetical protein FJZ60_02440 [Chlamydiae bacterium]|nr:hypothetical protein [Chlamydiota bacterium]
MDHRFEDRIDEIDLLEIKDLESLTPFFQDGLKFLHQFKVIQAKGDLVEKMRLAKIISQFKEILLGSMDKIEERLKLSREELGGYMDRYEEFKIPEQEYMDLLRAERNKTFHKTKTPQDPVAKMKKGKTKVKNWMRP